MLLYADTLPISNGMKPRTKIILSSIAGIALVGGSYLALNPPKKKTAPSLSKSTLSATGGPVLPSSIIVQDSDKDGIADWEEALWKTDPQNPDSDGDGISDGDEVKANRDPSLKGAGNLSVKIETETPSATTATGKFSLGVLQNYIKLKEAEQTGTKADIPTPEEFLKANEVKILAPQYKPSYFSTVQDTKETRTAYAVALDAILKKYSSEESQGELEIFAAALQSEDKEILAKLKPIAEKYRSMVKDLLVITVPNGALLLHTDFVNSISALAESTISLADFLNDPLKGMSALTEYDRASTQVSYIAIDLEEYFNEL